MLRGLYGGATMVGGGLALMVVPPLTDATGWRAPYWTGAVLALAAALPVLAARGLPRSGIGALRCFEIPHCFHSGRFRPQPSASPSSRVTGPFRYSSARTRADRRRPRRRADPLRGSPHAPVRRGARTLREDPPGRGTRARRSRRGGARILALGARVARPVAAGDPRPVGLSAGFRLRIALRGLAAERQRPDAPSAAIGLVNGMRGRRSSSEPRSPALHSSSRATADSRSQASQCSRQRRSSRLRRARL